MQRVYCAVVAESLNMIRVKFSLQRQYHGSGVWSPSWHCGPITSQPMSDLWWTKLHRERFSSGYVRTYVVVVAAVVAAVAAAAVVVDVAAAAPAGHDVSGAVARYVVRKMTTHKATY